MSKVKETVHIDNIEVGYVGLFHNKCSNIKHLRKIMFARILDEDHMRLNCSNRVLDMELQQQQQKKGIDLCEKIYGKKIIYPIINSTEVGTNFVDDDIIIFNTIEVGTFLRYVGFPLQLNRKDLTVAQKILLEPKVPIMRQRTPVMLTTSFEFGSLNDFDISQLNQLKEIIEPLQFLKDDGNSRQVRTAEKVYARSAQK